MACACSSGDLELHEKSSIGLGIAEPGSFDIFFCMLNQQKRLSPRVRVDVEKMNPAHKLSLAGYLVFSLLVLLLILMGQLAELLDSRKNLLSIWEGPSLAENFYELNYYKSFLEKEKI